MRKLVSIRTFALPSHHPMLSFPLRQRGLRAMPHRPRRLLAQWNCRPVRQTLVWQGDDARASVDCGTGVRQRGRVKEEGRLCLLVIHLLQCADVVDLAGMVAVPPQRAAFLGSLPGSQPASAIGLAVACGPEAADAREAASDPESFRDGWVIYALEAAVHGHEAA